METPVTVEEFIAKLFDTLNLPDFMRDEEELRRLWSEPDTRKNLLNKLNDRGFSKENLVNLKSIIEAEESDLFDVLQYISFAKAPITREDRVLSAKSNIYNLVNDNQRIFIDFLLDNYVRMEKKS